MWTPTHVQVTVHRARNLIPKGKSGTNDCYVSIQLGKEKYQTSVKEKTVDPEWHEECDLTLEEMGKTAAKVVLSVHHRNLVGLDEFLGRLELPLSDFPIYDNPKSKWYDLLSKPGKKKPEKYRGELEVKVAFIVQSKTSSTLSLNSKSSSLLRTGSFKSIASLGDKLKLPKRAEKDKHDKDKPEKEKKSKTLSGIMDPFHKKKSGSKDSKLSKSSVEDVRGAQFYDDKLDESGDLEASDADAVFKKVAPAKPARSNKLSQQQHLSMSVPGLTGLKKGTDFGLMKAVPINNEALYSSDEDVTDELNHSGTGSQVSVPSPRDSKNNPFEDDWEEGPREQAVEPFVRQVRGKTPTAERSVDSPQSGRQMDSKGPSPQVSPLVSRSDREDFRPPLPKSAPPTRTPTAEPPSGPTESQTPTLDGVMSSIGLGSSSPLVSSRRLEPASETPVLSARLVPGQQTHRKVELSPPTITVEVDEFADEELKSNDSQDSGFSRTGSYRQPILRGSNRVKRAASDADAKKPEAKSPTSDTIPLSDTRVMASSTGKLDDKTVHRDMTLPLSDDPHVKSSHSVTEVIPEVDSPSREDLKFGESVRNDRNPRERKYSADGHQMDKLPPSEHRLVVGQESIKIEPRQQKTVILPPEILEQYAELSREELIRVAHQQKKELERKQNYIKDLENYIDNLLVRVMETQPRLLQKPLETGLSGLTSMAGGHHRDSQTRNTRY